MPEVGAFAAEVLSSTQQHTLQLLSDDVSVEDVVQQLTDDDVGWQQETGCASAGPSCDIIIMSSVENIDISIYPGNNSAQKVELNIIIASITLIYNMHWVCIGEIAMMFNY